MPPTIVILERIHTEGMRALSTFAVVNQCLGQARADLSAHVAKADAIVVRSVIRVDAELLDWAPALKAVGRAGTGTDNIDLAETGRRGIRVVTTPGANADSTADFTVGQILCLCRRLFVARDMVQVGDFRRHLLEGRELSSLTVGIVGLGNVGRAVARRLSGFGCRLLGYDPAPTPTPPSVQRVNKIAALYADSDVLTFHVDMNDSSYRLLDAAALQLVKPGALIINAARAGVIDDNALLAALDDGRVAAAAVDVVDPEPTYDSPPEKAIFRHPLIAHPRVVFTPHMAASTDDAQARIARQLADGLRRVLIPSPTVTKTFAPTNA